MEKLKNLKNMLVPYAREDRISGKNQLYSSLNHDLRVALLLVPLARSI